MTDTPVAVVPVKSPWWSKINWLQVGGVLLTSSIGLVSGHAIGLDDAMTIKVLMALNFIQGTATFLIKTYFTGTVTPQSLPS